jgi:hypothetical protein
MGFLNRVKERSQAFSWEPIINVPHVPTPGAAPIRTNLIENYGIVTMAECKAHATAYLAAQARDSQLSAMLYSFLRNSLSSQANKIIDLHPTDYTLNGLTNGTCLLKYIVGKSFVDTNSTVTVIRKTISKLDEKIKELKYDIKGFNQFVEMQVSALAAHGHKCEELINNLFSAYLAVKDEEFLQLVCMYFFQHEQSQEPGDPNKLMQAM